MTGWLQVTVSGRESAGGGAGVCGAGDPAGRDGARIRPDVAVPSLADARRVPPGGSPAPLGGRRWSAEAIQAPRGQEAAQHDRLRRRPARY